MTIQKARSTTFEGYRMNVHCKPLFSARLLMAQHTIDAFFNLEKAWVRFFAGRQFK